MKTMKPQFELGQVRGTPGAVAALGGNADGSFTLGAARLVNALIYHHTHGDWGCVDAEDAATNDESVANGSRILSAYPIDPAKPCAGFGDNCLWIITEADRSYTTIMLPEEY